jgi:hypothetical protein
MKQVQALGLPVLRLPSSSPANASWSFNAQTGRLENSL